MRYGLVPLVVAMACGPADRASIEGTQVVSACPASPTCVGCCPAWQHPIVPLDWTCALRAEYVGGACEYVCDGCMGPRRESWVILMHGDYCAESEAPPTAGVCP